MKEYKPRKKKLRTPILSGRMKIIRIDARTQIEVSVSIPNDVAIERYYQRHTTAVRPNIAVEYLLTKDECFEVPQEELAAVIDDSELSEEE